MAEAARAYSYGSPARVPVRPERPRVRVVPGQKPRTGTQTAPSSLVVLAKAAAVVLVVAALLCCLRVAIGSATVAQSVQAQQLESQIAQARAAGSNLEVRQSALSNPTNVKNEAAKLKMAAPETVGTIDVGTDVVATDASGNLSLSESAHLAATAE
ncbi:MAG: cell division protein FtsL [Gordonibacter sp.]|uniref:cell division protein FtsL n=1 Tax=Gordonibacter sp. TaxID=1968902 RepID=UPI002FCA727A